jgi:hypothetical protein
MNYPYVKIMFVVQSGVITIKIVNYPLSIDHNGIITGEA